MKNYLNFIITIILIVLNSGCAYISEIGLLHEANMSDAEFEVPLKIEVQPNLISNHMMVKSDGSLWSMDVNFRDRKYYPSKEVYLGRLSDDFLGKVEYFSDVKEVAANRGVVVVLKNDGTLWSWGRYRFGGYFKRIGLLGYNKDEVVKPHKLTGLPLMRSVALSGVGVTAIDVDGNVWKWGKKQFPVKHSSKFDYNLEINAVAYNLPFSRYLEVDVTKPIKVEGLESIVKISKEYQFYLTEQGEVLKLILPRFVEIMSPYIDGKVGEHLYKMKLPSKAVDVVNNTVLLSNGHVYELATLKGVFLRSNYGQEISPTRRISGLSRVVNIADKVALTEGGDLYRWGDIYMFGTTPELRQYYFSVKPVYVGNISGGIKYFSRDLMIINSGSIYLYGNQKSLFGFHNRYWPEESRPFFYKNYFFSPFDRRKSVKNSITYFKLVNIVW